MIQVTTSDAIARVRKNIDEVLPNASAMYIPTGDENNENLSLDDIIKKNLPEAINAVHLDAPATVLVGKGLSTSTGSSDFVDDEVTVDDDGVMVFEIEPTDGLPLRVVQFKAVDSPIVVTSVLDEATPEGRKQLNKYIRGRSDRPRLVRMQDSPYVFKYYSLTAESVATYKAGETDYEKPKTYISLMTYLPRADYGASSTQYNIDSTRILQNIYDCLTGMVLETYAQPEKAKVFYDRSSIYH